MSTQKPALSENQAPPSTGHLAAARTPDSDHDWTAIENGQRALLNILEGFAAEKSGLESGQRAVLNILDDFDAEKARMEGAQRAVLNILEDSVAEKTRLEAAQRSMLNILDDFASERTQLEAAQGAMVNILDDFSEEKGRLEETQRAVLNILDDFETEKNKVELANQQLEKEIEERKRAEEETLRVNREVVAANKELETFSYSVSHDLRAPLRTIDGFSHALLEDCADRLDDAGKTHLNRIRAATQRMGSLIDDLLNLSRLSRTEMHRQSLDISALACSIASDLQKAQPERRIELRIEDGLKTTADPGLLRVVLENLLSNAWKFTSKQESARIEFGMARGNGAPAYFVRDDGVGFDPAYADRLFGAFQRLHATTDFAGTGVGLATVQRIVHRHGGRIWAESAVGQGATFYFTIGETAT
jgi:signal transduction histidine kinase